MDYIKLGVISKSAVFLLIASTMAKPLHNTGAQEFDELVLLLILKNKLTSRL
jgi:hypothetical protein